jgi:branched-chain amino acid transport system ATP-binding protein
MQGNESSTALLLVENIVVSYGPIRAVRGLSLTVGAGEIVALIGPNGAGKTTTLRSIAGLKSWASGSIALDGDSLAGRSPEAIARAGIALVPEGRRIFTSLTVEENLRVGAATRRDAHVDEDIDRMYSRFPILRQYRHAEAGRLSGGEQQQLAFSRALLARPRILLLDEPSLGLAPALVTLVFKIIQELHDEGVTILLVEQNARKAMEVANRTYLLRSGVVVRQGEREDLRLMSDNELEEMYLGRT